MQDVFQETVGDVVIEIYFQGILQEDVLDLISTTSSFELVVLVRITATCGNPVWSHLRRSIKTRCGKELTKRVIARL